MSRRPRNQLNLSLRGLQYNPKTGYYEVTEAGITYQLTFSQMNDLKTYYSGSQGYTPTFSAWYNSLDRFAKKEIKLAGTSPAADYFFPDPVYD